MYIHTQGMQHFTPFTREALLQFTRIRRYETKLGEKIHTLPTEGEWEQKIQSSSSRYVLLGVIEDIGVKANHGIGGTGSAWTSFLKAFCNMQSSDTFSGDEILLAGVFDFSDIDGLIQKNAKTYEERIDAWRHAVSNIIDNEVEQLVRIIIQCGKIPLVIGGGHNNAYPLIKGCAKGLHKSGRIPKPMINAINVDAHADYRISEGRHSGNGFRYAMEESYLGKYAVVGLHTHYNAQSMMDDLYSNINIQYFTFEDIFLHEKLNFRQAVAQAFSFAEDGFIGVELDLDSIRDTLSSAVSPVGISPIHARQYMSFSAHYRDIAYLHICEGAEKREDGREDPQTGKLIAYLLADFMRSRSS